MRVIDAIVLICLTLCGFVAIKLESDASLLERKILNNAAFELEGRILRCNDVISNEASTKAVKK